MLEWKSRLVTLLVVAVALAAALASSGALHNHSW